MEPLLQRRIFEFCFIHHDYTLVRVEEEAGEVLIRATADTFNDHQKRCFVREIAAEGFIPDDFRWFTLAGPESYSRGVRWVVDNSWLEHDGALLASTQRWIRRLLVPATLVWMIALYLASPAPAKAAVPPMLAPIAGAYSSH